MSWLLTQGKSSTLSLCMMMMMSARLYMLIRVLLLLWTCKMKNWLESLFSTTLPLFISILAISILFLWGRVITRRLPRSDNNDFVQKEMTLFDIEFFLHHFVAGLLPTFGSILIFSISPNEFSLCLKLFVWLFPTQVNHYVWNPLDAFTSTRRRRRGCCDEISEDSTPTRMIVLQHM